jgi:hypothetical protein
MPAFTVIDHTELGAAASSYNVTSIPSSYDHLYVTASVRSDYAANFVFPLLTFNGDSGTNYSDTELRAIGNSTLQSSRNSSNAYIQAGTVAGSSVTADTFGIWNCWIPNYAGTTGFKAALVNSVAENASSTYAAWCVNQTAGLWHSTAAINQITLAVFDAADFVQYSTFTLYGVTGA